MRLNITGDNISLKELVEVFAKSSNVKAVYNVCHQAGCPVYVIRTKDDKLEIFWHPNKDESKDVILLRNINGEIYTTYKGEIQPYVSLEASKKILTYQIYLGENPFDDNFKIYDCEEDFSGE